MNKIYSALVLFTLLATSCNSAQHVSTNLSEVKKDNASIVFLVFKIVDDSIQHKRKIELIRKIEAPGKIKINTDLVQRYENYLDVNFYDDTILVTSTRIEHPLFRRVEFTKDDNSLTSAVTRIPEAEFFLRVQLTQTHNYTIKISETLGTQESTLIADIPLLTQSP
ncbi:hypothetical protein [Paracoccus sp. (in: a-proteobacteria)]|uniref:hypothetical protein n=1 Tax=Paracoccus sp. TaxID=267 RepID=UPI002AFF3C54|nr:hypothetical protein [Paracoccus sp. (in: a-proteobacteria)]